MRGRAFDGKYEFGFGSVTAMRKFAIKAHGLTGVGFGSYVWTEGENVCECYEKPWEVIEGRVIMPYAYDPVGKCDNPSHECGFWAYYKNRVWPRGDILGVIEGYGKCTIGTKGVRVEKAQIKGLVIPRRKSAQLWGSPRLIIVAGLTMYALLIGALFVVPSPYDTVASILSTCLNVFLVVSTFAGMHRGGAPYVSENDAALVREKYPNVPIYPSKRAMLRAHKLTAKPGRRQ